MSVTVGFFNLANGYADESVEGFRYSDRLPMILRDIETAGCDILCASEFRACKTVDKRTIMSPFQLVNELSKLCKMDVASGFPQNLDGWGFWRATFYNSEKLDHFASFSRFAVIPKVGTKITGNKDIESPNPQDRGVMVMFSRFIRKSDEKPFWVINMHMPMPLGMKLETIDWLNKYAHQICQEYDTDPVIFYGGDQNTFFDREDRDGFKMMDKFAEKWEHLSEKVTATFTSFPHDVF